MIRNHRRAADGGPRATRGSRSRRRRSTSRARQCRPGLGGPQPSRARRWDDALALGEAHGYRNAQVTVIAPTGTIGLVMDCDTTGIEPDFALVKFKKLAGGGYFKIINHSVPRPCAPRLRREADRATSSPMRRPRDARACAARQPCGAQGQGPPRGGDRQGRGGAPRRFRHPLRLQQVDARRRDADAGAQDPARALRRARLRPADRARLLEGRDRGRQQLTSAAR